MRSIYKKMASVTLLSSILLNTVNAADGLEATLSGSTDNVFTIGGTYNYSDLKMGLGAIAIKDLESNTSYKDDFYGGYLLLGYTNSLSTDFDLLLDAVYINGETKETNQSLDKLIASIGLKYTEDSYFNPSIGINTEETAFLTLSRKISSKLGICVGTAYDWDDNEGKAFLTLSYGNGLTCNSSLISSTKTALEDEFNTNTTTQVIDDTTDATIDTGTGTIDTGTITDLAS